MTRQWSNQAIACIEADFNRSADTHLVPLKLAGYPGIDFYFKDESSHPTGSLKHRLARSLFLYALANGWLRPEAPVIEASSGSTAVSEAYFARLLGLPFIAVMPKGTSPDKIAAIEFYGGRCHLVDDPTAIHDESLRLASETGGHFMDQFTYAERATDWRANNNIAESIFQQMRLEPHPLPAWIVAAAGTGGTSATIGRYVRYRCCPTRLLCPDPEGSAFYQGFCTDSREATAAGSRIEGIGRPRVEASFMPHVIDTMVQVPDLWSLAAMHELTRRLGYAVGGSSGTNLMGALWAAEQMKAQGESGSIVSILCDGGARYRHSYYNHEWLAANGFGIEQARELLAAAMDDGSTLPALVSFSSDQLPT
ncbi:MAG: PLP-dependent cysteine synthase family protein [Zoogloeaceae bacterium]|nr:PLP-dependent cysteine synthase family protein [Zoogloeaceae bacterium]